MDSLSPERSSVKQLPAKLGRKLKHRFRRISGQLHHVIPSRRASGKLRDTVSSPIISTIDLRPTGKDERTSEDTDFKAPCSLRSQSSTSSTLCMAQPFAIADSSTGFQVIPDSPVTQPGHAHKLSVSLKPDPTPLLVGGQSETLDPLVIENEGTSAAHAGSLSMHPPFDTQPQSSIVDTSIPSHPTSSESPPLREDSLPVPAGLHPDEETSPELHLPTLIVPSMFLPISNTDPLNTLLVKYISPEERPSRDITGHWKESDFHTLVMTNSWRALATMAQDRLVTSNPQDVDVILDLWYIRLASLARLRLFNQTSAECTKLFDVLHNTEPPESRDWILDRLVPFELEVMQTRVKYWAGDYVEYVDSLHSLLGKCRIKARQTQSDTSTGFMWKERAARVYLMIASQLTEMKEFRSAAKLLEALCNQGEVSVAALRSSVGRIYLQSGDISAAAEHFAIVAADNKADQRLKDMNNSLLAAAQGDWEIASNLLKGILEKDQDDCVAANNLSVALLSQGKLRESINVLETTLKTSPSTVVVAEPFLFNLSTLYELRSSTVAGKKRDLLIEVAKWSGDGLRVACLKMPTN